MPAWIDAGWDEYARRLPREFALELVALKPEPRDRGKTTAQMLAAESQADRRRLHGRAHGRARRARASRGRRAILPSASRAGATTRATSRSSSAAPTGSRRLVKRDAAAIVALSALTLPHGLVRVMLAEQLYRATSLYRGHPYHRE